MHAVRAKYSTAVDREKHDRNAHAEITIIDNKALEELVRHSNLNQRTTTHPSNPPRQDNYINV